MDTERSIRIIEALAEGTDPETGEVLPSDHLLQSSEVVRALYHALSALRNYKPKETNERSLPANAGNPWSPEEDAELVSGFRSGQTQSELASTHGRTSGAIRSRLVKHGLIQS